jgi:hypothetical protein
MCVNPLSRFFTAIENMGTQERRVIIITTVRSSRDYINYDLKYTLGFVANPRRLNGELRSLAKRRISRTYLFASLCYSCGHSCKGTFDHSW